MSSTAAPQRIVVTGATGIAAAAARSLAKAGRDVVAISATQGNAQALIDSLGAHGKGAVTADLGDEDQAVFAFATARELLGGIDGVVAVAGGSGRRLGDGPLHEIPLSGWEGTLRLNLTTTFLTAREAVRTFLDQGGPGSLVLTTSVLGWSPSPEHFTTHAYATTKAAICGMTTTFAATYARHGIRVNAVAPGLILTPMAQRAATDPVIVDFASKKQPLAGGMIEAEDVGAALHFLLDQPTTTGQILAIDGGWSVSEGR